MDNMHFEFGPNIVQLGVMLAYALLLDLLFLVEVTIP
jgi:hypothetical protein